LVGEKVKPPLTGIKIADFSRVLAGPYATMLLADLGAQVIKVERPVVGDDTRGWGPPFDKDGNSTYFLSVNRNKEGLELDLSKESDQKIATELINSCDVLVENFGPGGMEKFNLGYARLIGSNPKLIYCSISGFGTSEKAESLPGYDLLLQGMSGLMSITGSDENNPSKVGVALVDVITGLHAVVGILAALRARDEQGIGQKVELNLLSSTLSALVNQASSYISAGVIPKALGNAHPSIAPYQVFDAKDKKFIVAVGNDAQFIKFAGVVSPDLIGDKRFATNQLRVENRDQLNALLSPIFATNTANYWITALSKINVPAGAINNMNEAFDLAQSLDLKPIVEVDGVKSVANPIKLSKTPVGYHKAPPNIKS
jgi:crotonobetainyl-CoA:carnitine CoA-transferase CaiB-like acyl-CoA transferase